jgi:ergothioneine biosynthesis protein EgtB
MNARLLSSGQLVHALGAAREATFACSLDLTDAQWMVPYDPGIQPVAWDLAHIAWFAEFWLLRGPHRIGADANVHARLPSRLIGPDDLYDSARVSHPTRWRMPLYSRAELIERMHAQLAACQDAAAAGSGDTPYFAHFALFHELMHVEALAWTRALLALPAPPGTRMSRVDPRPQVELPDGERRIGRSERQPGFSFDNELLGRTVRLRGFAIDEAPVTNERFLAFVMEDGYRRPELWPGPAGEWLARAGRSMPERWRCTGGVFEQRWFDEWRPLAPDEPVVHVNAFEAEAWCRFAGRRLPTAAEWEAAAPHVTWGRSVWEWTADAFAPYPGFRPAPYHTYSAPWFHHQRELRGGAFATHELMHDAAYRNFFLPWRTDVFAGFRSVALD